MINHRSNTHLAAAVEHALDIHIELGPRAAADFLADQGASFALACRVLAEPGRRRARELDLPPSAG